MITVERPAAAEPAPPPDTRPETIVDVAGVVVLVQAGMAVTMAIAAVLMGTLSGFATIPVMTASALAAAAMLLLAKGVRCRSSRARTVLIWVEGSILLVALIEFALAIGLADRGLGLTGTLTRIVVPIWVVRTLRRQDVRAEFGVPKEARR